MVEKLTKNVREEHLKEIFGAYGQIRDLDMPMNRQCKHQFNCCRHCRQQLTFQSTQIEALPTFFTLSKLMPKRPLPTCTNLNLTGLSLMCPLSCLAENSHHPRHSQDEVQILIPEGLHLPAFAVDHLLDADHHPEAMGDLREPISTLTDRGLFLDPDHLDNTEVPTGVAQGHTPPDPDHHQEDVEGEDVTVLGAMLQGGEVQAIAAIAVMMTEAEVEVGEEEVEDGAEVVELLA